MMAPTMRTGVCLTTVATGLMLAACATTPQGAYYAAPTDPSTARMAPILHRAAVAG